MLEYLSGNGIRAGLRANESRVDLEALRTQRAAVQGTTAVLMPLTPG